MHQGSCRGCQLAPSSHQQAQQQQMAGLLTATKHKIRWAVWRPRRQPWALPQGRLLWQPRHSILLQCQHGVQPLQAHKQQQTRPQQQQHGLASHLSRLLLSTTLGACLLLVTVNSCLLNANMIIISNSKRWHLRPVLIQPQHTRGPPVGRNPQQSPCICSRGLAQCSQAHPLAGLIRAAHQHQQGWQGLSSMQLGLPHH